MKRIIPLSLIAVASLYAAEIELAPISVEAVELTEVSQSVQTSSDIAEALAAKVPSIDMIRRSGIANDVHIRGQKRDNISVEVDGTKIFGACPNRMDPPTSHILASQVNEVTVTEGPYDVETFGTMSGGVKMTTKQPSKELHGEVTMGIGSFNYRKVGATVSGGNDTVRVLISASSEASDQYEDGDGNSLAEQAAKSTNIPDTTYQTQYEDVASYKKKSLMAKAFVTVTDDQELRLSYTQNKSDGVLYPNTPMDAVYDYSNIYSVEYEIKDLTDIYKNVNLQYYYSEVDHPMDNAYRVSGAGAVTTHHLSTSMQGLKLKNSFDIESYKLLVGLDGSKRIWDGAYSSTATPPFDGKKSINNVSTRNAAIFTKLEKSYGDFSFTMGARYDSTEIDPAGTQESNSYNALNASLFTSYNLDRENRLFLGFGQASRVPDPRELYYMNKTMAPAGVVEIGTPDLDQTTNQEIDLGYEASYDMFSMKIKGFYSMLDDYIYFNTSAVGGLHKFTNIDATIYGAELTASVYATDDITVDMGVSYKRGEKDEALDTQDDKDLADITPLRGNIAVNYEYMNNSIVTAEVQAADKWSDYDEDNGEQELDAWSVLNLKVKHAVNKNFDFTLGVNNVFDETYAVSNTYADLTLVAGGGDVLLLNEPGRYVYTNLSFKF
ncbi:MAG: TonB-dependent receptor [Campylobacterota bacterium]|nr:TonB-dependent receptor [Campylobacterota bacterium]